jgi:tetratricopeptide (TPR) repeat protein
MLGSQGKEKELHTLFKNSPLTGGLDLQRFGRCLPATFMGNDGFTPHSEHYNSLYMVTRDRNTPWELYAAIKYALALNLPEEAKVLKNKLRLLGNDQPLSKVVRYYDFSIQAFEARQAGNDDLALTHIDSAHQYMFAPFWIEGMASRFDKTIMAANIFTKKGNYEKAISLYNPAQYGAGFPTFRGYATYQLSNWYKQIENQINTNILLIRTDSSILL